MTATDLLRIFRAQTAAVEGAGFPLAAYLGGAPIWTLPIFALLGIVAHFGGFGENSISDLAYDRTDPSKADHPIVAGRVKKSVAGAWVLLCQLIGIVMFVGIAESRLPIGPSLYLPVGLFIGYIVLGHAYNFFGKRNKPLAVLEISGSFALAFLAMGSVWTGGLSSLILWVGVYAFFFVAFQIAVAGELKEIGQANEGNLLRRMGAGFEPGSAPPGMSGEPMYYPGGTVFLFGLLLSWVKTGLLVAVLCLAGVPIGTGIGLGGLLFGVPLTIYSVVLLMAGPFNRPHRLKIMGAGEALSYVLLVLAVSPALGPWLVLAFVLLPVLWFAAMNRLLWSRTGSAWAPGV